MTVHDVFFVEQMYTILIDSMMVCDKYAIKNLGNDVFNKGCIKLLGLLSEKKECMLKTDAKNEVAAAEGKYISTNV
ncbi:MAG: hypothetical protein IJS54_05900 [Desulfovibrio sp.]|nr:hypothetical protein [Desulfovibrio sp.]